MAEPSGQSRSSPTIAEVFQYGGASPQLLEGLSLGCPPRCQMWLGRGSGLLNDGVILKLGVIAVKTTAYALLP